MKKVNLLLLGCFCLLLTGCGGNKEKVAGTTSDFTNITTSNGLVAVNNMNSYLDKAYIIDDVKATLNDITIEMAVYDTEDNAKLTQDNQIKSMNNLKSINSTINKDEGKNYYKYVMVSNGYYMVTSRIDNTLIFAKTLLENQSTIDNILNEMNY